MFEAFLEGRVTVKVGDLTRETVDAIVNAANSTLMGGGGVDGAIHRAGGPSILAECRIIRAQRYPDGLPAGQAVLTTAGYLPARYVIHTVGPVYGTSTDGSSDLLADCYRNSLQLADDHDLVSVAFPSISTGAFGYPKIEAAKVVSATIRELLESLETVQDIRLVFISEPDSRIFVEHAVF